MHKPAQTAILIFSRTAQEEARHKKYCRSRRANIRIAQHLIAHTSETAARAGFPVISILSDRQRGNTFGEKLANAIESVFALGYTKVITLGTDTPDLKHVTIREIERRLLTEHLVIGPSNDGGVYAIGVQRQHWNRSAFIGLRWESCFVQDDLNAYAALVGTQLSRLSALHDLDHTLALNDWLHKAGNLLFLAQKVRSALQKADAQYEVSSRERLAPSCISDTRRGPPAWC